MHGIKFFNICCVKSVSHKLKPHRAIICFFHLFVRFFYIINKTNRYVFLAYRLLSFHSARNDPAWLYLKSVQLIQTVQLFDIQLRLIIVLKDLTHRMEFFIIDRIINRLILYQIVFHDTACMASAI